MINKRSSVFACVIFLSCVIFPATSVYAQQEKPYTRIPGLEEKLNIYFSAWNTADLIKRRILINQVWAVDGRCTYWGVDLKGREELMRDISLFHHRSPPGYHFVFTSEVDSYEKFFRYSWSLVNKNGKELMQGMDYGELDENGMLSKIVGFFGSLQPLKSILKNK